METYLTFLVTTSGTSVAAVSHQKIPLVGIDSKSMEDFAERVIKQVKATLSQDITVASQDHTFTTEIQVIILLINSPSNAQKIKLTIAANRPSEAFKELERREAELALTIRGLASIELIEDIDLMD